LSLKHYNQYYTLESKRLSHIPKCGGVVPCNLNVGTGQTCVINFLAWPMASSRQTLLY